MTVPTASSSLAQRASPGKLQWRPCAVLAVFVLVSAFFRPGDAPWINDEPNLIRIARDSNITPSDNFLFHISPTESFGIHLPFTLAPIGLEGSRGIKYGPFPTWIYQIFLLLTSNPIIMVMLRAGLFNATTAIALYWLTRTLRVSPWLAVVTILSPWQWVYSRQLWDNSFCIPLSAMMLAAYGDFLRTRRGWTIALAMFCGSALLLVHFMSLPLLAPFALHLVIIQFRGFLRHIWIVLIFAIMQFLAWPFWYYTRFHHGLTVPTASHVAGWFYPLLGAHHLTATDLGNILGYDWVYGTWGFIPYAIIAAATLSMIAYPAVWLGMALSIRMLVQVAQFAAEPREHLAAIGLTVWLFQSVLDGLKRVYGYPHYYNATWIVYVIFAWIAADYVWRRWAGASILIRLALPVYAASLLVVLLAMIGYIIRNGGTRTNGYGTTLANQMQAVRQVAQYADDSVRRNLYPFWLNYNYPHAATMLWELTPKPDGERPRGVLVTQYVNAFPNDAHIEVIDVSKKWPMTTQPSP